MLTLLHNIKFSNIQHFNSVDLLHGSNQSNVLPSSSPILLSLRSHSREPKTVINIPRGHSSILQGRKNLPLLRRILLLHRTSHEARRTLALVDVVTDRLSGVVFEGTGRGTWTHVCRVGGSKAEGTVVVNVDLLATGDRDILLLLAHTPYTPHRPKRRPGYRGKLTKAPPLPTKAVPWPLGQGATWETVEGQ